MLALPEVMSTSELVVITLPTTFLLMRVFQGTCILKGKFALWKCFWTTKNNNNQTTFHEPLCLSFFFFFPLQNKYMKLEWTGSFISRMYFWFSRTEREFWKCILSSNQETLHADKNHWRLRWTLRPDYHGNFAACHSFSLFCLFL